MYENFWPQLLRRLENDAPWIQPKPNRLKLNYWTFAGPTVPGAWSVWSCNFPKNPSRLRVEIYFGNELQRRNVDVLDVLRKNEDRLRAVYDRPEELIFEKWVTGNGHVAERLAVYRPGDASMPSAHPDYVDWFVDRLVRLQEAVAAACSSPEDVAATQPGTAPEADEEPSADLAYAEKLVELLDRNPLFHLSLGSRELFHSNLIAWMTRFPVPFQHALRDVLEPASDQWEERRVRREAKQLDLVIELPGHRPLIIENKVFSLPDTAQLEKYAVNNIPSLLGDRAVTRVLLSLVDPGWPEGVFGPPSLQWRHLAYRDLAAQLRETADLFAGRDDDEFAAETVRRYASLLDTLDELVAIVIPRSDEERLDLGGAMATLLDRIRLRDTMRKLRGRHLLYWIKDELMRAGTVPTVIRDGFAHGHPILEAFVSLANGDEIGWQLQEGQFRICLIAHGLSGKGPEAKAARARYAEEHYRDWFTTGAALSKQTSQELYPASEFRHFDPAFVYRYLKVKDLTLAELRALAIAATRDACEFARATQATEAPVHAEPPEAAAREPLDDVWWAAFE